MLCTFILTLILKIFFKGDFLKLRMVSAPKLPIFRSIFIKRFLIINLSIYKFKSLKLWMMRKLETRIYIKKYLVTINSMGNSVEIGKFGVFVTLTAVAVDEKRKIQ